MNIVGTFVLEGYDTKYKGDCVISEPSFTPSQENQSIYKDEEESGYSSPQQEHQNSPHSHTPEPLTPT